MKYRLIEQAADEARAGIEELDAEIDRLSARRELLQVLDALVYQALTVLPMNAEALQAGEAAGRPTEAAVAELPSWTGPEAETEDESDSGVTQEPLADFAPHATEEMPFAGEAVSPGDAPERLVDSTEMEDLPTAPVGEMIADQTAARSADVAHDPAQDCAESLEEEESAGESPAVAAEEETAAEYHSLSDLLWREEPYSLRKRGWPAPSSNSGEDEREIRKKLL
jgi:hypothetical protein